MKTIPTFYELLARFGVRGDCSTISSNVIYPWDDKEYYTTHGKMDKNIVRELIMNVLDCLYSMPSYEEASIANKYAIPMFATGSINTLTVWFAYQHDDDIYLLSREYNGEGYFG